MKSYNIYNLCITSELNFPDLIEIEGEPDVNIRFGKVNDMQLQKVVKQLWEDSQKLAIS